MATFVKTALVALALASTAVGGAFAQQADQATPTDQTKQVTPPVRSRVATRQILLEPTAAPVQVAAATVITPDAAPAVTPAQAAAAPAQAAAPAPAVIAPQVADAPAPKQVVPGTPAPAPQVVQPNVAPVDPGVIVRKGIEPHGYGYSPRYAGGYGYGYRGHNCH